ncbi:adenylyl-sulfate kinase [Paraglaciecola polaris]|uniref:Adenylyl-sulfate kinase n=1 Tax=Paraglaciecola polaris LMG 21857 TaxID=1129793 RepID=K6YFA7_9ALTE|nr:adenylyl-sulfate kinase [Paraglaciecola polaris]GAC31419.1 adenylylsulfate kinase [Paraglaciecola polaris LMG 21857]|tara:strand:+ start:28266 stop:28862 length:597 start_codon:yes stop_codon:yes gene_type:complete
MEDNIVWHQHEVNKARRGEAKKQKPCVIWLTGLSGSGKSTIANLLEKKLADKGKHTYLLDGDNVRHGLNGDLTFSDKDRVENIRRISELAKLFVDSGLIVITAFISPFKGERDYCRALLEDNEFVEVFVNTPIEECEKRDPKGLYQKARSGEISDFTGISSPYEAPETAEITLDFSGQSAQESAEQLFSQLQQKGLID